MQKLNLRATIVIVSFLLFLNTEVEASLQKNVLSTKSALAACTKVDMDWVNFCNGFFQAVHDHATINGFACTPKGITRADIVTLYHREAERLIQTRPELGKKSALSVGSLILSKAFPCQ